MCNSCQRCPPPCIASRFSWMFPSGFFIALPSYFQHMVTFPYPFLHLLISILLLSSSIFIIQISKLTIHHFLFNLLCSAFQFFLPSTFLNLFLHFLFLIVLSFHSWLHIFLHCLFICLIISFPQFRRYHYIISVIYFSFSIKFWYLINTSIPLSLFDLSFLHTFILFLLI